MVGRKLLTVVLYEFFICMRPARKFSRAAFHVNCLFLISFNHLNPRGKRHMYYRLAKKTGTWCCFRHFQKVLEVSIVTYCTIAAKKFRPPVSCHFTKIGCCFTFIVIMINVCRLKFEIYYCHP
jgi:hypothetical protein